MPVMTGSDTKGCYARWGGQGKKYYYKCGDSEARDRAKQRAAAQGRAAHANGYKSKYSTGYKGGDTDGSQSK